MTKKTISNMKCIGAAMVVGGVAFATAAEAQIVATDKTGSAFFNQASQEILPRG